MDKRALEHSVAYMDSWLRFRTAAEGIPGVAVAVSHQGRVLLDAAYGFADIERGTRLAPRHMFRIASHSKTFTATAVMQLVEQGALRLDDPVVDHLGWLADHPDPRMAGVTVRQLLSHGAGILRDGIDSDHWQLSRPFPDARRLRAMVLGSDLVLNPNVKLKYSNIGYGLLGLVVEAASGQAYNAYVTEHIVDALGLADTGAEPTEALADRSVTGYTRPDVGRTRLPVGPVDTRALAAATGFYSTASDLCAYFTAQMVGSGLLLSDGSKREMQRVAWHAHTPAPAPHQDYGLGMQLDHVGDRRTFGHSGGFPGQITRSMADPADGLVVVVLTNSVDGPATAVARGLYRIIDYFQAHAPVGRPKRDLRHLEGRYMNMWSVSDVIVSGDRVVVASPQTWEPLAGPDVLEAVDATTLRIAETSSFGSEGELVRFTLADGKVVSVNDAGGTMWPEAVWLRRQRRRLPKT